MKSSVIIIGSGPVGIRAVEEISSCNPELSISIYGGENCTPYNRVLLSSYLAGKERLENIEISPKLNDLSSLTVHYHCPITRIDPETHTVYRSDGKTEQYDKLIIATGSHPHVPEIPNIHIDGVFTFRDLKDADALRSRSGKSILVLGGGLLGLETAAALKTENTEVTVLDHSINLMNRQLDKTAGDLLMGKVLQLGLRVVLADGVAKILGKDKIEGVRLRSGKTLTCDSLVLAVGIRPNIELAAKAGIKIKHGIVVNEFLQTSHPDIYAVGECAEFKENCYGIVAPGFEQAAIMAKNLTGGKKVYKGSQTATRLKVLGFPVFSMGSVGEKEPGMPVRNLYFEDPMQQVYRRLIIHRNRVIGCIALGEWTELSRIRTAIEKKQYIWACQTRRFAKTGLLWADQSNNSVVYWPDSSIVCNCSEISRGRLGEEIKKGCQTVDELSERTKASTVCGSCRSLLSELIGSRTEPVRSFRTLAFFSILAALAVSLFYFLSPVPYQQTATIEWDVDTLWRDNFIKQVTGYGLLVSSVLVLILSLRKRIKGFHWGDFALWRMMHVILGGIAIAVLLAHTGLRFGENLNFYLMLSFSGLILIGSLAGIVISAEHKLNPGLARKLRGRFVWIHILLFWPLPALLGFHILQTYYF